MVTKSLATTLVVFLVAVPATASLHGIPGPQATVVQGPCPTVGEALGCAVATTKTVYVYSLKDHFTLQHELGHLFDAQRLNNGERGALEHLMHKTGPWPAETFADAFATCRLGLTPGPGWTSSLNGDWQPDTPGRQRHMCATIRRFAQ